MFRKTPLIVMALILGLMSTAQAEILTMLNCESKPQSTPRREGIAIIDVDPKSESFARY